MATNEFSDDAPKLERVGGEPAPHLNPLLLPFISRIEEEQDYLILNKGKALALASTADVNTFHLYLTTQRYGLCRCDLNISYFTPLLVEKVNDISIILDTYAAHLICFYDNYRNIRNPKLSKVAKESADGACLHGIFHHRLRDVQYIQDLPLVVKHINYLSNNKTKYGNAIFNKETANTLIVKICIAADIAMIPLKLNNKLTNIQVPFLNFAANEFSETIGINIDYFLPVGHSINIQPLFMERLILEFQRNILLPYEIMDVYNPLVFNDRGQQIASRIKARWISLYSDVTIQFLKDKMVLLPNPKEHRIAKAINYLTDLDIDFKANLRELSK